MDLAQLTHEHFPLIYEHGRPVAVLVDLATFRQMVKTLTHLQKLVDDPDEAAWIMKVVTETRATARPTQMRL